MLAVVLIIAIVLGVVIVFWEDNYGSNYTTNEINMNDIEMGTVINSYNIENTDLTLEFDEDMMQFSKEQIAAYVGKYMHKCMIA